MVAEMTAAGAAEHLDTLASKYAGQPVGFSGDAIPASFPETETPVLYRIRSAHVIAFDATRPTRRDQATGRPVRRKTIRARHGRPRWTTGSASITADTDRESVASDDHGT